MVAAKKSIAGPKYSDYLVPGEGDWSENNCPGSVGSMPNLVDIERQFIENTSAQRENRKPQAIAIHCGFCQGYHLDMQPDPEILIANNRHENYLPRPVEEPEVDGELVTKASEAVANTVNNKDDADDDSGDKSKQSDSNSGNSGSSSR